MTCHTCGVILKIPGDAPEFSCWYCGTVYHPRERDLGTTLSRLGFFQAEEDLTRLKSFKVTKLDELGKCLDEIIRLRSGARQDLLLRRKQLEEEILDINLNIHMKESALKLSRHFSSPASPGD